jgi:hypothetical protein
VSAPVPTELDVETLEFALDQCDELQLSDVLGDEPVLRLATSHRKPGDVAAIRVAMGS